MDTVTERSDAELLAAVRDALYKLATGYQTYTLDGATYTRADLDKLRILESTLTRRVAMASSPTGGIQTVQVVF